MWQENWIYRVIINLPVQLAIIRTTAQKSRRNMSRLYVDPDSTKPEMSPWIPDFYASMYKECVERQPRQASISLQAFCYDGIRKRRWWRCLYAM